MRTSSQTVEAEILSVKPSLGIAYALRTSTGGNYTISRKFQNAAVFDQLKEGSRVTFLDGENFRAAPNSLAILAP